MFGKPTKVQEWEEAIALGEKYRKQYSSYDRWADFRDYYRGKFPQEGPHNQVVLNRTFSYIRSMIPRLYFRTPGILAIPRRQEFVAHSRVIEAVDNWLVRETDLKHTLKSAILDTALCGTGPIKLGYDSEYGYDPDQAVDRDSGTVTQVARKDGKLIEYNANIQPGMPWAMRVRPDEVITPYGYANPNDMPWIPHQILRPVEDIQQDSKYNQKRMKIKGGYSYHDRTKTHSMLRDSDAKDRMAMLYEIRDLRSGKFIIMCEGHILLEIDDALQVDGLPWEHIIFNEDPEHFWGISDVAMFEPQQLELNEIRSHARRMRRLEVLKFLYARGAFKPEELEKLLSADPYDMGIGIEVDAEHLQSAVHDFKANTNTDGLIREQELTDSDFRSTMGFSQNQMGNYVPFHNKTKGEAEIVNQAASIRSDERRDIVADTLERILRKWNQFIIQYWDKPRVAEIVGNDGYKYWIEYTGEQLRGEYALNIQPEEGMPISREVRHQTATELYDRLANDPMIDQVGLRRLLLQQTDIIDPSYMGLLRPPTPNPNMNVSQDNPMSMQDLMGMTGSGQALGPQPNPTGGGNAPV